MHNLEIKLWFTHIMSKYTFVPAAPYKGAAVEHSISKGGSTILKKQVVPVNVLLKCYTKPNKFISNS